MLSNVVVYYLCDRFIQRGMCSREQYFHAYSYLGDARRPSACQCTPNGICSLYRPRCFPCLINCSELLSITSEDYALQTSALSIEASGLLNSIMFKDWIIFEYNNYCICKNTVVFITQPGQDINPKSTIA